MDKLMEILQEFRKMEPEEGLVEERKDKFMRTFKKLKKLYCLDTELKFCVKDSVGDWYSSEHSVYFRSTNVILLVGKLDPITLLHEIAHALGCDELGAVAFSLKYEEA